MSIHRYTTAALAATLLALAGCGSGRSSQVSQTARQAPTTATQAPTTATQAPTTGPASSPSRALPPPSAADRRSLEKALALAATECTRVGAFEFSTGGQAVVSQARASISQLVGRVIALLHRIDPQASVLGATGTRVTGHLYTVKILEQLNYRPPVGGVPPCAAEAAQRLERATGTRAK